MNTELTIKLLKQQIEASETIIRLEQNTIDHARKKIEALEKYAHETNHNREERTTPAENLGKNTPKNSKLGFGFGESPI